MFKNSYCINRDMEDGGKYVKGQLLLYPTLNMCNQEDEFYSWSIDKYEIAPKYKKGVEKMFNIMHSMVENLSEILGTHEINSKYLSPYVDVSSDYPSTFITVGEHDFLMIECLAYAAKLTKKEVETETVLYRGLGHAYGDNVGVYPQSEDLAIEMGKFILKQSGKQWDMGVQMSEDKEEAPETRRIEKKSNWNMNDAFNRTNSGSLVDLVGSPSWTEQALKIQLLHWKYIHFHFSKQL